MNLKKIILLSILLVVVFSAVSATSALSEDITIKGNLTQGSVDFDFSGNQGDFSVYNQVTVCDVDISDASGDDLNKIKSAVDSDDIVCNITRDDGTSNYDGDSDMEVTLSGTTLHITVKSTFLAFSELGETHKEVTGGCLVLHGDGGNITIEF